MMVTQKDSNDNYKLDAKNELLECSSKFEYISESGNNNQSGTNPFENYQRRMTL